MLRLVRRLRRDQRGQSVVLFAVMIPLLAGATGLAVTVGSAYAAQAQLQNGVDAGALAGAQAALAGDNATTEATTVVQSNDPGAQDVTVRTSGSAVTVSATSPVGAGVAALIGVHTFTVGASGTASDGQPAAYGYTLFQGDTASSQALDIYGSVTVDGSVHSNDNVSTQCGDVITGSGSASDTFEDGSCVPCQSACTSDAPIIPMPQITAAQLLALPNVTVIGSPTSLQACQYDNGSSGENTLSCTTSSYDHTWAVGQAINLVVYGSMALYNSTAPEWNGMIATINGNVAIGGGAEVENGDDGVTLAAIDDSAVTASGSVTDPGITFGGSNTISGGLIYAPAGNVQINGSISLNGAVLANTMQLNGSDSVFGGPTTPIQVGESNPVLTQ